METLKSLCQSIKFKFVLDKSENGIKIYTSAWKIFEFTDKCQENLMKIDSFAGKYDLDQFTPANGYRSFLAVFNSFIILATKVSSEIDEKFGKIFLWKSRHAS